MCVTEIIVVCIVYNYATLVIVLFWCDYWLFYIVEYCDSFVFDTVSLMNIVHVMMN